MFLLEMIKKKCICRKCFGGKCYCGKTLGGKCFGGTGFYKKWFIGKYLLGNIMVGNIFTWNILAGNIFIGTVRAENHLLNLISFSIEILGQIFDVCRISVTRVSAPERCFIYYWRKCLYLIQLSNFLELRQVSLRYDKRPKFGLLFFKFPNF